MLLPPSVQTRSDAACLAAEGFRRARMGLRLLAVGLGLGLLPATASAVTFVWTGAGPNHDWDKSGNWQGNVSPPTGGLDVDIFINNSVRSTTSIANDDYKLSDLTFGSSAGSHTLLGNNGKKLIFEETSGSILNSSSSLQTISVSIIEAKATLVGGLQVGGSGNLTINSEIISDGGITKVGAGTLTLSGNNQFTGILSVQEGTLSVATVNNSDTNGPLGKSTGAVILGNTGGTTGTLLYTGGTASSTKRFDLATGGTGGFNIQSGGATLTLSGIVGGQGGLQKSGAGTLTLTGGNTYTGATTVSAGILSINADTRLGTAPGLATASHLVLDGGTLESSATFTLNANRGVTVGAGGGTIDVNTGTTLTYNGIVTGTGTFNKVDAGTLVLGGGSANTHTGDVNVVAGTLRIATSVANGAIGDSAAVSVSSGATLAFNGGVSETIGSLAGAGRVENIHASAITLTTGGNNASTTFSGVLHSSSGNLSLVKTGTGTMTLSGTAANTYQGTTSVHDGTLNLAKTAGLNALGTGAVTVGDGVGAASSANLVLLASHQIADSTAVTINADGRLALNGFSESIASIAGTGLVALSTGSYLTIGADGSSSTFGGAITGPGTLEKAGAGILTFSSSIDFSGTLALSGGTLRLDGTNATLGSLNVTGNSTIDFAGSTAMLSLTNFTIASGVTLNIVNWAHAADFFFTQNWAGAPANTRGVTPLNQVTFSGYSASDTIWQSYDKQITPVPEPSTYGALLLLIGMGLTAWRRHARRTATPRPVA